SRLYPLTKVTNKHLLPVYDTDTVGCHLATLAGSRCRVIDYNNIINIFRPEPPTAKMPPAQPLSKHLTMKSLILKRRPEIELQQPHDLLPAANPDRCGAGRVFYG
ncbi:MAG: hypothetical protein MIO93_15805, partial [ANME-2 cluster archaeon]|nr:hypothetical protein [ANME-2 cluster archaeon]